MLPLNLLGFLRGWQGALTAVGVLAITHAGAYSCGRSHGAEAEQRAEAKRLAKAHKAVAKREKKADAITEKVSDKLTQERVRIEYRTRTIVEKVPVYVSAQADAACRLPVGFRLLHDAAARGGEANLPQAPGGSELPDPQLTLSAATETVVLNYGEFHRAVAENRAWRSWYAEQARAWAAKP